MEPINIGSTVLMSQMSATTRAIPAVLGVKTPKIINDQLPRIARLRSGIEGKIVMTI